MQTIIDINVGRLIEGYVGRKAANLIRLPLPATKENVEVPPLLPGKDEEIAKRARLKMRQGQWSAAMESVQGLTPTDKWVEPLRIIGDCQLKLGRADLAEEAFRAVVVLRSTDGYAHGGLGMALRAQGGIDEAITSLSTAIDYSSIVVWPARLADTLIQAGRRDEARALLQRSILIWQDHPVLSRLHKRLEIRAK